MSARRADRRADLAGAEVGYAWQRLLRTGGRGSVSDLATATGWSERHLRGRFRAETGLTPKAAARVIRFHRARRLLARRLAASQAALASQAGPGRHAAPASHGAPVLADLAADCGYYDQAHLAREFRALAGCSPTEWLADEFRFVQAMSGGWGADSGS